MDVQRGAAWSVSTNNRGLTTSPPEPFTVTLTGRHHKNSAGKHLREFSSNTTQKREKVHASGANARIIEMQQAPAAPSKGSLTDTCPCLGTPTMGEGQAHVPVPAVTSEKERKRAHTRPPNHIHWRRPPPPPSQTTTRNVLCSSSRSTVASTRPPGSRH